MPHYECTNVLQSIITRSVSAHSKVSKIQQDQCLHIPQRDSTSEISKVEKLLCALHADISTASINDMSTRAHCTAATSVWQQEIICLHEHIANSSSRHLDAGDLTCNKPENQDPKNYAVSSKLAFCLPVCCSDRPNHCKLEHHLQSEKQDFRRSAVKNRGIAIRGVKISRIAKHSQS